MLDSHGRATHECLRPVAAVILFAHHMRVVAERHGCTTPRNAYIFYDVANAIGLIQVTRILFTLSDHLMWREAK